MVNISVDGVQWYLLGFLILILGMIQCLQLGLVVPLITAILRSLVQLLFLGGFLVVAWEIMNPWVTLFVMGILISLVAIATQQRIQHASKLVFPWVWGAICISTLGTLGYIYGPVFRGYFDLTHHASLWITLTGVACHHLMNTLAITGEHLVQAVHQNRAAIETHLCLGAKPQVAIATYRRSAIRAGLLPTIQSMKVTALISVPLLMAGELLAGTDPITAAITQFSLLLLLVSVTLFSSLILTWGLSLLFFNRFDQLIDDAF